MIRKIAQFRIKEGLEEETHQVIGTFVEAIVANEPKTDYVSYQLGDSRDFIHYMAFPDEEAENFHRNAPYTLKFVEALYPNCEVLPTFTVLKPVAYTPRP